MSTLIVGLVLLAAVILAIRSIIKDQGSCSGCSKNCSKCHPSTSKGIEQLIKESRARHAG